jgi:hypothetical protein
VETETDIFDNESYSEPLRLLATSVLASAVDDLKEILEHPERKYPRRTLEVLDLFLDEEETILSYWLSYLNVQPKPFKEGVLDNLGQDIDTVREVREMKVKK